MKKRILLGTVALAAMTSSALAADLPSRRAPPVYVPPIPVFSWTGFYVGGQIGFGFGDDRTRFTGAGATAALNGVARTQHPNGILGGGHVGYNFSTQSLPVLGGLAGGLGGLGGFGAGGLVIGIEGDIDASDFRNTVTAGGNTNLIRNDIQGSARGRVGIAVDRALFYATGGAAFAEFQTTYTRPAASVGFSNTRVGYTVGGGVEYAITTQWSLRGEYRYSDFGTFRQVLGPALTANRREILQRAQVGFSYKFDTPVAPVVARY